MLRFIPNARAALLYGASMWCNYIAVALLFVEVVVPFFAPVVAEWLPAWLDTVILALLLASPVLRVIKQRAVSGP